MAGTGTRAKLTAKGTATRERIIAAAASLMHKRGIALTSTQDVQRAAAVSASQLYHYFPDKRALVHAVIAHETAGVLSAHRAMLVKVDSFEALEAWRDLVVAIQRRHQCEGGCPLGSLANELAEVDPEARIDLASAFAEWELAIRDGLANMRARGELYKDTDVDRLALGLLAALQGGLLLTKTRRDTLALEAGLDAVIERIRMEALSRRLIGSDSATTSPDARPTSGK
jgi:TetR/AcrR family transcriptional regulator, transcriptional repressor for nem operon